MGAFFIYILKSSVCLVLFYLFFRVLLSKETFHRFNRVALLGVLCFSLLIPFVEITTRHQVEVQHAVLSIEQLLMMVEAETTLPVEIGEVSVEETAISWIQIVLLIYLLGIVVLACRNIYSLFSLLKLIRSGKREKMEKGVTLVVHEQQVAPFSWMRYIVISRKDLEENGREILIHEMAHIRNRHSVDLLVADVCIFFQWFNPGAWLLKQELQNIHEYEADETVIKEGVNAKEYQLLLIKKAVGTRLYSMANSFNHSKLKKRITMMLKEKSSPWARLKYLYVLPLAAIAVTAFARPEISEKVEEISAVKVNDLAAIVETKVEEMTKGRAGMVSQDSIKELTYSADSIAFLGGSVSMEGDTVTAKGETVELHGARLDNIPESYKSLIIVNGEEVSRDKLDAMLSTEDMQSRIKNVTLLEGEAAVKIYGEKGKNGVMDVQLLPDKDSRFKVEKDNAKFKATIKAPTDSSRAVMSATVPGIINGPENGKELPEPAKAKIENKDSQNNDWYENQAMDQPLIIVDGKEGLKINELPVDRIKNFNVLKGAEAIKKYGDKANNGVIEVELYTEKEYKAEIKRKMNMAYNNAWEMAIELNTPQQVSAKKVIFYVNGVETSEEELKKMSVNKIYGGLIKIRNKENDETIIHINTKKPTKQTIPAWGLVHDENMNPIEGVSVVIEGTEKGTITSASGYYMVQVPKNTSLQCSKGTKSCKIEAGLGMNLFFPE